MNNGVYVSHTIPDVLVLGDINADMAAALTSYPREGDDSAITALTWCSGGAAVNVTTALALLGSSVALIGRVGSDPAAEVALRAAARAGVQLELVQHDTMHATGLCVAAVSLNGQRTFFSFRGANVYLEANVPSADVLRATRILHICGHALLDDPQRQATLVIAQRACEYGALLSLDLCAPAARLRHDLVMELLPTLSILFMNEDELDLFLPDMDQDAAFAQLIARGAKLIVLKRGEHGCLLVTPHERLALAALSVEARDTTGCGDAFAAGFIWAHQQGASLLACAAIGNLLGGITATQVGAADALPSVEALHQQLEAQPMWVGTAAARSMLQPLERLVQPSVV